MSQKEKAECSYLMFIRALTISLLHEKPIQSKYKRPAVWIHLYKVL